MTLHSIAALVGITKLFDQTLTADTATIDTGSAGFSTAMDNLLISVSARTTEAAVISSATLAFNNDTAANYDTQIVRGQNVTASAGRSSGTFASHALAIAGANAATGVFGVALLWLPAYSQTVGEKSWIAMEGLADEAAAGGNTGLRGGHWRNTAAINRIALTAGSGNLLTGTRLIVYGI